MCALVIYYYYYYYLGEWGHTATPVNDSIYFYAGLGSTRLPSGAPMMVKLNTTTMAFTQVAQTLAKYDNEMGPNWGQRI